jgi:5-methylcytosine-specific restriction endonuclease McrA
MAIKRSDFPAGDGGLKAYNKAWSKNNYAINRSAELKLRQAYYQANRQTVKDRIRKYYQENRGARITYVREREFGVKRATLSWQFMPQIEAFYVEARRLTEETGVNYVVDHIWPINGRTSCGLHTPWNLRVITQAENDSKGNKEPEDTWSSVIVTANHGD